MGVIKYLNYSKIVIPEIPKNRYYYDTTPKLYLKRLRDFE